MAASSSTSPATSTALSYGSTTHTGSFTSGSSAHIGSTTTLTRKRSKSRTMNITPIRTKTDHKAALKEIESLMSAKANTPEGDRLDVLATLVEAYERAHFPMDLPDAV